LKKGNKLLKIQNKHHFQTRVFEHVPANLELEKVEVVASKNFREIDPRFISWKGATVLALLESIEELWINATEWSLLGVRSLREKAPFLWSY
jgi:actin-related protein